MYWLHVDVRVTAFHYGLYSRSRCALGGYYGGAATNRRVVELRERARNKRVIHAHMGVTMP
jgi:hypothetical protein